jgi:hypothetical protein
MNTKIKIAIGMLAGVLAGVMLVGTAVAAPRTPAGAGFAGYGMMRSFDTSGTFDVPTWAEMSTFMSGYRTADGSVDFNRMRADVTSGKATPPCLTGARWTGTRTTSPRGQRSVVRPSVMMRGWTSNGGSTGYGMMGSNY